jgi:hypothetical protein
MKPNNNIWNEFCAVCGEPFTREEWEAMYPPPTAGWRFDYEEVHVYDGILGIVIYSGQVAVPAVFRGWTAKAAYAGQELRATDFEVTQPHGYRMPSAAAGASARRVRRP